jgi:hypothetical protein
VVIENPGNVDALNVPLWVTGIPTAATVTPDFVLSAPPRVGGGARLGHGADDVHEREREVPAAGDSTGASGNHDAEIVLKRALERAVVHDRGLR